MCVLLIQRPATTGLVEVAEVAEGTRMTITGMGGAAAVGAGAGTATGSATAARDVAEESERASLTCMGDLAD